MPVSGRPTNSALLNTTHGLFGASQEMTPELLELERCELLCRLRMAERVLADREQSEDREYSGQR